MPEVSASRYLVMAGWDSVPHLDETTKADLLASTPPHLRDARSKGLPSMGMGAVYPIPWEDVSCEPFAIPAYWPRCYGLDVGWKKTAAVWIAENPQDGTRYAYAEHYKGEALPMVHAAAINARGKWIKGAIDPASNGRSQIDGQRLLAQYTELGLNLALADNSVDAGIHHVWSFLETGRLKFFSTLANLRNEYRLYRREEYGPLGQVRIVKKNDHALDALRYGMMRLPNIARVQPVERESTGFSPADKIAGY